MATFSFEQSLELDELKKKLRSRIRSIEKLVDRLVDDRLLGSIEDGEHKSTYILRILQKLKEEVNTLERADLLDARHARAARELQRYGFTEGAEILRGSRRILSTHVSPMVKTAQQRNIDSSVEQAIGAIRSEITSLSYTRHLHNLYEILTFLEKKGRGSEVDSVAKIIRDELPNLEGMTKKLTDVFTALGKLPLESAV